MPGTSMWLDGIAVALLVGFGLVGAWRGTLATALRLGSLALAYGLSIWFAPAAAAKVGLAGVFGVALAGAGVFIASYLVFTLLSWGAIALERRRRDGEPRTGFDRTVGAGLGVLRGGLVALLLGWLALWGEALRVAGPLATMPPLQGSTLIGVTRGVVGTGVGLVVGDDTPGARLTARMASDPADVVGSFQDVIESPRFETLRADQLFWSQVSAGEYDEALNRASFLGIAYDETLRWKLADVGLVTPDQAREPRAFRDAMSEILHEIGPRLRQLREDPETRRLLEDPEVQEALREGNTMALVSNPGFRKLVERVSAPPPN